MCNSYLLKPNKISRYIDRIFKTFFAPRIGACVENIRRYWRMVARYIELYLRQEENLSNPPQIA